MMGEGQEDPVIDQIAAAQREELEREISGLKEEAAKIADDAQELVGEVSFGSSENWRIA